MTIFQSSRWMRKVSLGLSVVALGAGAALLPACGTSSEEIGENQTNVTTEDFPETSEISNSIGEVATVRSPIQETLDANGFLMQTNEGAEEVLVLNVSPAEFTPPTDDTPVQVTGRVAEFVIADVESAYGLELDENLYVDYEQQPVILADSWALAPTPEMLAEEPEAYYNQRIAVEGDARILSSNAIAVFEDGWIDDYGILVTGVGQTLEGETRLQEGESVTITGTAQPFDINMLKGEYDLGLNDQELNEFSNRYTDRPVIMADGVYPSAVDD